MAEHLLYYNELDVTLLADSLQAYSKSIYNKLGLDPLFFCSSPACAYQSCLKVTKQQVGLISDPEMYRFERDSATGGLVTTGTRRLAYANNCKMPVALPGEVFIPGVHYNPLEADSYIVPVDVNSLYPSQGSQTLPTGDHRWEVGVTLATLMTWNLEEGNRGFIATIDGHWPAHLHKKMKLYVPMPVRRTIGSQKGGKEHSAWLQRLNCEGTTGEKLVADLCPRVNYGVHGPVLQWAVKNGFVVTKVHKVLSFAQARWMKPFFDICVAWRKEAKAAKNKFEDMLAKLFMNSAIGKFACDVSQFKTIRVISKSDRMAVRRCLKSATFDGVWYNSCGDNMFFLMQKANTKLNFPSYVGHYITCVAKQYITKLLHDHFFAVFGFNVELVYSDTDSAVLYIIAREWWNAIKGKMEREDVYHTIETDPRLAPQLDFSEYPAWHPNHDESTAGTLGLSKPEAFPLTQGRFPAGMPTMCVALRKKMWCLMMQMFDAMVRAAMIAEGRAEEVDDIESKIKDKVRAKGVAKKWMEQNTKGNHYERLITHPEEQSTRSHATVGAFRAHDHEIRIDIQTKKALSSADDTTNVSFDGITALPWGYEGEE